MEKDVTDIFMAVAQELRSATENFPTFNTAHEGYAVLLEEVDELWDLVKVKQSKRDPESMQREAIQIAAMAIRFAYDVCYRQNGSK